MDSFSQLNFLNTITRLEQSLRRIPALKECGLKFLRNDPDNFTPDGKWILGETPEIDNYFVAAGMNGNSLQGAGGIGHSLVEWITEGEPDMCLIDFDVRRFVDVHNNRYVYRYIIASDIKTNFCEDKDVGYNKSYAIFYGTQEVSLRKGERDRWKTVFNSISTSNRIQNSSQNQMLTVVCHTKKPRSCLWSNHEFRKGTLLRHGASRLITIIVLNRMFNMAETFYFVY
jgi:hypothetical protein